MWRVSQCCGYSLKTGTMMIMWYNLLSCSFGVVIAIQLLSGIIKIQIDYVPSPLLMLAYNLIALFISISALVGAIQRQSALMKPYIILSAIALVVLALFTALLLVSLLVALAIVDNQSIDRMIITAIYFIFVATYLLISCHFFCVVYSYYKEMQEEQTTGIYIRDTGVAYSAPKRGLSA